MNDTVTICTPTPSAHSIHTKRKQIWDRQCTYNINYGLFTSNQCLLGYPNSLIPFHSKQQLLRGFNVASRNKVYLGLHVKCQIFLPSFNQFGVSLQIFIKVPNIIFHRICPMGAMLIHEGRRMDMMKLKVAFCYYINAPYNSRSQ